MKTILQLLAENVISPSDNTYLRNSFDKFNDSLFDGKLPKNIPITFVPLKKGSIGRCVVGISGAWFRPTIKPGTIKIEISNRQQYDSNVLDGLIVHEMIHAFLFTQNDTKTEHGGAFLTKLKELEAKGNIRIPIDHDPHSTAPTPNQKPVGLLMANIKGKNNFALISKDVLTPNVVERMHQEYSKWKTSGGSPKLLSAKLILCRTNLSDDLDPIENIDLTRLIPSIKLSKFESNRTVANETISTFWEI